MVGKTAKVIFSASLNCVAVCLLSTGSIIIQQKKEIIEIKNNEDKI